MAKIYLASDHAGYELKEALIPFLREHGHDIEDIGPSTYEPADDYPDYLLPMAAKVAGDKGSFGIGIGASGQGEAMVANRVKGARAAVYYGHDKNILVHSRHDDDANILSLGAKFMTTEEAKEAVATWLQTPFAGEERFVRRIHKLGFTVVEVLIATAIIGLLAGIVVVNVQNGRASAQDARRKSDLEAIKLALGMYAQDYGDFMSTGSGCGYAGNGNGYFNYVGGSYPTSMGQCLVDKGYMSTEVLDPTGGRSSSAGTETYSYMKYNCGSNVYLFARLKTQPSGPTVENAAVNATCCTNCDTAYGMNYVLKVK
jgi:ribose 5-phosphate isomerase B